MKKTLLLAALFLAACGTEGPAGPSGPTGPSGPPGSYTKDQIYCESVSPAVALGTPLTASWVANVYCHGINDLPLQGGCQVNGLPADVTLIGNRPTDWDTTTSSAGWSCLASTNTPSPEPTMPVMATICCITQ